MKLFLLYNRSLDSFSIFACEMCQLVVECETLRSINHFLLLQKPKREEREKNLFQSVSVHVKYHNNVCKIRYLTHNRQNMKEWVIRNKNKLLGDNWQWLSFQYCWQCREDLEFRKMRDFTLFSSCNSWLWYTIYRLQVQIQYNASIHAS